MPGAPCGLQVTEVCGQVGAVCGDGGRAESLCRTVMAPKTPRTCDCEATQHRGRADLTERGSSGGETALDRWAQAISRVPREGQSRGDAVTEAEVRLTGDGSQGTGARSWKRKETEAPRTPQKEQRPHTRTPHLGLRSDPQVWGRCRYVSPTQLEAKP